MPSPSTHQDGPKVLSGEDILILHDAAAIACAIYDFIEKEEGGVSKDAPLYGKRDRLEELARQLDHEANCENGSGTYLSVFALVSDEVVEALTARKLPGGTTAHAMLVDRIRKEVRADLQALIEQVGGGQGGR